VRGAVELRQLLASVLNRRTGTDCRVSCFKSEDYRLLEGGPGSFTLVDIEGASFALVKGQTPRSTRPWRTSLPYFKSAEWD
jgi:hypothetical protein